MKRYLLFFIFTLGIAEALAQTCNDAIRPSTPTSRFILTGKKGTAIDKQTGLEWMRCALGQTWNGSACVGDSADYSWQEALAAAEATEFAGFKDWRLPNLKELGSLVELACYGPAINAKVFSLPVAPNIWWLQPQDLHYWTSTVHAFDSKLIASIYFQDGVDAMFTQDGNHHPAYRGGSVRLVRRGL